MRPDGSESLLSALLSVVAHPANKRTVMILASRGARVSCLGEGDCVGFIVQSSELLSLDRGSDRARVSKQPSRMFFLLFACELRSSLPIDCYYAVRRATPPSLFQGMRLGNIDSLLFLVVVS